MTKDEALAKIEELKKFVEEMDKKPEPAAGQVWKSDLFGTMWLVTRNLSIVCVEKGGLEGGSCVGVVHTNLFPDGDNPKTYLGMAKDILTINR
jgi:hypothetical protein